MSVFNPEEFLNQTVTASFSTKFDPVPEGEWPAVIDDGQNAIKIRTLPQGQVVADVLWNIVDEQLKANLGKEKLVVRQSVFLDLNAEGKLDFGKEKNVQLGRIREALGQNFADRPWNIGMLKGAGPAKLKVTVRDGEYNDVKGVNKIG